ncbi:MAG: YibE/F family protein [Acidimicrobiales bacterium]
MPQEPWRRPGRASPVWASSDVVVNATVAAISACDATGTDTPPSLDTCAILDVAPTEGAGVGQVFRLPATRSGAPFTVGDKVVVEPTPGAATETQFRYVDRQRLPVLAILAGLLVVGLVASARLSGLRALVAFAAIGAVVVLYTAPALVGDTEPALVAAVSAATAVVLLLVCLGGVGRRVQVALVGALATVGLQTGLGYLMIDRMLLGAPEGRGIALTSVVIGSVGALAHLTSVQAADAFTRRVDTPTSTRSALVGASLRATREQATSTIGILMMAYLAAALPALVVSQSQNYSVAQALNSDLIAGELAAAALAGIVLLAALPITAGIATLVALAPSPIEIAGRTAVVAERPPVRRAAPTPARRRREAAGGTSRTDANEPSLWERMRQGLDD